MQERNRESSKRSHKSRFDARRVSKKIEVNQNLKNSTQLKREIKGLKKIKKGRGGQIIVRKIIYPKKVAHSKKIKKVMLQRSQFKRRVIA